jgi:hypothetical protein
MRTKFYLLLITLIALVGNVWGEAFLDGMIIYRHSFDKSKTVSVVGLGSYPIEDLVIPPTVTFKGETYTVSGIEKYAFEENPFLKSVTINLTALTYIRDEAFSKCPLLTEVKISEGLASIGKKAFYGCHELVTVSLPSTIQMIDREVFYDCISLKSLSMNGDFNDHYKVENGVLYSSDMSTLVAYPLACDITSFRIHDNITRLDNNLFSQAVNIAEFTVSEDHPRFSVIDGVLFDKNKGTLIRFPPNKKGGDYTIPERVSSIEEYAFAFAKDLTKISFPQSLYRINIGVKGFRSCDKLESFEVSEGNRHYKTDEHGVLYDTSMSTLIAYPNARKGDRYDVPDGVQTIGINAFSSSVNVKNISLPDGLISIQDNAFSYSASLETIHLPNSITSLGSSIFESCAKLKTVTLPDNESVNIIDDNLFRYTESLKSIKIPDNIHTINERAFEYSGLESVTLPDGLTSIYCFAFAEMPNLTSIVIPKKITSMFKGAFYNSKNIREITLLSETYPTHIGAWAFYGIAEDAYMIVPAGTKDIYVRWVPNYIPFTADNIYEAATVVVDPATGLEFIEDSTGKVLDKLPEAATGKDYIILPKDDNNYEVIDVKINGDTADMNTDGQFYVTLDGNKDIKVTIAPKEIVTITTHTVTIEHLAGTSVSKSLSSYEVEEGGAFSFTAIATDKTSSLTVYVNGTELAPTSDDFYHIDGITEDLLITFSLTDSNNPTANERLSAAKISARAGTITIESPKKVAVQIISFVGQLVYSSDVIEATVNVPSGIYAVVVDGVATKIVVK